MSRDQELSIAIVGIAGCLDADVAILINLSEVPVDADSISSSIHHVSIQDGAFQGVATYNTEEWLTSLTSTNAGTMFACSMDGNVHVYDGQLWSVVNTNADQGLNCVHAITDGRAVAVAMDGGVFEIARGGATLSMVGEGVRLNWIHGCSPQCIYAVGDDGQMIHFDGNRWARIAPMTNVNLLSVCCVAPDDVYVGGTRGIAFHWNGTEWRDVASPSITISSMTSYRGKLYVAGGKDGVYVVENEALTQLKPVTFYKVGVASDLLFGVGARFFAWFDGVQWRGGEYVPN